MVGLATEAARREAGAVRGPAAGGAVAAAAAGGAVVAALLAVVTAAAGGVALDDLVEGALLEEGGASALLLVAALLVAALLVAALAALAVAAAALLTAAALLALGLARGLVHWQVGLPGAVEHGLGELVDAGPLLARVLAAGQVAVLVGEGADEVEQLVGEALGGPCCFQARVERDDLGEEDLKGHGAVVESLHERIVRAVVAQVHVLGGVEGDEPRVQAVQVVPELGVLHEVVVPGHPHIVLEHGDDEGHEEGVGHGCIAHSLHDLSQVGAQDVVDVLQHRAGGVLCQGFRVGERLGNGLDHSTK